jgi:hypothetical protein
LGVTPLSKGGSFQEPHIRPLYSTRSGYHERYGALFYPSRSFTNLKIFSFAEKEKRIKTKFSKLNRQLNFNIKTKKTSKNNQIQNTDSF